MAHLQRSSTTGHLLKTSTGHLAKECPGDCTRATCSLCPSSFNVEWSGITGGLTACPPDGSCTVTQSDDCFWVYGSEGAAWYVYIKCLASPDPDAGSYQITIERNGPDVSARTLVPVGAGNCPATGTYTLTGLNLCDGGSGTVVIS